MHLVCAHVYKNIYTAEMSALGDHGFTQGLSMGDRRPSGEMSKLGIPFEDTNRDLLGKPPSDALGVSIDNPKKGMLETPASTFPAQLID